MQNRLYHVAFLVPSRGYGGELVYNTGPNGMSVTDLNNIRSSVREHFSIGPDSTVVIQFFGELAT